MHFWFTTFPPQGGKRTKKRRKQMGGFTYKSNGKRKIVPTITSNTSSITRRCSRGKGKSGRSSKCM